MASLAYQKEAAAILYAVLGENATHATFDSIGAQLQRGELSASAYVTTLLTSTGGVALFNGLSDINALQIVYTKIFGSAAPTSTLQDYLTGSSLAEAMAKVVNQVIEYSGFDSAISTAQAGLDQHANAVLFPSVSAAALGQGASDVQAIYYVTGAAQSALGINNYGAAINAGSKTFVQVAQEIIFSANLTSLNNSDYVVRLFKWGYERTPSTAELSNYVAELTGGTTRAEVLVQVIESLRGSVAVGDTVAQQHFNSATISYQPGQLPSLSYQEQVSAVYLAVPQRDIDARGLDDWSKYLSKGAMTYKGFIGTILKSSEFQKKGAQLTGDDFIQHVYTGVHGVAATAAQLLAYSALGSDKAVITQAIINDLRTSTATDAATVTQQHGFEFDIGTSLLYKTAASLTTTAAGGNATGTVNTGASHQISNAETAVLTDVQLAANAASIVNLKFADHLANLTINGTSAATVNLSDNGVNPGVDITVNNGNVILNASSGADDVLVTTAANVATATAKFNLGEGNDSLKWLGNATVGGANTVSTNVQANGGNGIDTISANFITKNVVMTGNILARTATITSNSSQFSNFEKIDLAGYIGKATVSSGSTAANNTFDFGVLTGHATSESSLTGTISTTINQAATSTIGSQGFVLSGLANAVNVINAAGGSSAQLEVTGNATAASSVNITFLQNATDHFNITFDAVSSTNVNAGSLALNSSSSLLAGTALTTLNIASGGTGSFENILSLTGTNAQVQNIAITGDHVLDLNLGSGFSNVRDVNASTNTGGLNLDSSHAGTGDGIIVQLLNALPLSAVTTALLTPLLNTLGLNGYQLTVEGSTTADSFNILGNTTLTGGAGGNIYDLKSSNSQAGVTITDFSTAKDKIVDAASGLTLSNTGTAVGDYGTRSADTLDALLGTLVGGLTTGVVGLLGGILGLSNPNSLTSKVGVASVVFSGTGNNADSYVIIDNNNNHTLDANDTVVYLTGQNHQQLVSNLHYA